MYMNVVFPFPSIVTEKPAQNSPILFNEILSYFSEKTGQNHKSCSQSMCREENFDFELPSSPSKEPMDQDIIGT